MGSPFCREIKWLASRDGLISRFFGRWHRLRSVLDCLEEGRPRRIWSCVLRDKCCDFRGHDLANVV